MTQPEAKFKRKLCEAYEEVFPDGWHFYFPAAVKFGTPDLYFSIGGRGTWVEAKVGDNTQSKIQQVQTGRMRTAGERVIVVTVSSMEEKRKSRLVEVSMGEHFKEEFYFPSLWNCYFWNAVGGVS